MLQLARQGNVFATDAILTTLMCCTRSVYPWDIVVQKVKDKIFLDKREDSDFGELEWHKLSFVQIQDFGIVKWCVDAFKPEQIISVYDF